MTVSNGPDRVMTQPPSMPEAAPCDLVFLSARLVRKQKVGGANDRFSRS
jgi:hypothetical protein